jgi:hypothetical protein
LLCKHFYFFIAGPKPGQMSRSPQLNRDLKNLHLRASEPNWLLKDRAICACPPVPLKFHTLVPGAIAGGNDIIVAVALAALRGMSQSRV